MQQPPFYSQPTWGQPLSPPPRKPNRVRLVLIIAAGVLVFSCVFFGIVGAIANGSHPTTQASPTATKHPTQAALIATQAPTKMSTIAPTATPTMKPSPTPTLTHAPQPTPRPTQPPPKPTPTPKPCQQPCNPWGYNFSPGNYITNPPSTFCDYFNCIASFWNGRGFVNECVDGTYSKSGGIRGDCSSHGGEWRPLYSH